MAYIVYFYVFIMNHTNSTQNIRDTWKESGAMVYVSLTVAIFAMVTMCCVWFIKHRNIQDRSNYNPVDEEVELTRPESSEEEEIDLGLDESSASKDNTGAFTLEDSDSSSVEEDALEANAV